MENEGEGYRGVENEGEGYRGVENEGEGYRGVENEGEGYRGVENEGEGYRGVENKGEGYRGVENEGKGYRGVENEGKGYRGVENEGEGYRGVETIGGDGSMPYPVKCLLEVNKDMVEIFLVLQVLFAEDSKVEICSVVLCPARKPACSAAMMFSACGLSLLRMTFNMTLLGWLMRLIVR